MFLGEKHVHAPPRGKLPVVTPRTTLHVFLVLPGSSLSGFVVRQPNSCNINTPHHIDGCYIDYVSLYHTLVWSFMRAAANHCKSIPLQHFWVSLPYLDSIPFQWWRPSEHGLGEIWTQRLQGDLLIRDTLHLGSLIATHFVSKTVHEPLVTFVVCRSSEISSQTWQAQSMLHAVEVLPMRVNMLNLHCFNQWVHVCFCCCEIGELNWLLKMLPMFL